VGELLVSEGSHGPPPPPPIRPRQPTAHRWFKHPPQSACRTTSFAASSNARAPLNTKALYSPRECPAAHTTLAAPARNPCSACSAQTQSSPSIASVTNTNDHGPRRGALGIPTPPPTPTPPHLCHLGQGEGVGQDSGLGVPRVGQLLLRDAAQAETHTYIYTYQHHLGHAHHTGHPLVPLLRAAGPRDCPRGSLRDRPLGSPRRHGEQHRPPIHPPTHHGAIGHEGCQSKAQGLVHGLVHKAGRGVGLQQPTRHSAVLAALPRKHDAHPGRAGQRTAPIPGDCALVELWWL
jgi:hypothetical protein